MSGSVELAGDRAGFGSVDRGGGAGHRVVDQIAEIVGQAGEDADVGGHDVSVGGTGRATIVALAMSEVVRDGSPGRGVAGGLLRLVPAEIWR